MFNNSIKEVQRQYTYPVQPVNFFEPSESDNLAKSAQYNYNDFSFLDRMKKTGHNPFYPDVSYSQKGSKLDLMG